MRNLRTFSGTNAAKRAEARMRCDIDEALEYGIASDVANKLLVRGKRHGNRLPNSSENIEINRGHIKEYGVRPEKKKKVIDRRSIRENPLTEEDFYDEPEL